MKLTTALTSVVCAALAAGALTVPASAAEDVTWLLVSNAETLPADLSASVAAAGGRLGEAYPFGVARVRAPASFRGVAGTTALIDSGFVLDEPPTPEAPTMALPPNSGDDDVYFDLQWGHVATRSVQAWQDGVRGQGVRVAVLDTAFDVDHPDLAPNINLTLSRDFTGGGLSTDNSPVNHGTHVAGIIAAADNGVGTIGVAPDAELVLMRVMADESDGDQVGEWGDILAAIHYAASPGVDADIINMSLGETVTRRGSEAARLVLAVNRAVRWAFNQGSTVVVSAGNEKRNLDRSGTQVRLPAASPQAITVAAAGPVGWAASTGDVDFTVPLILEDVEGRPPFGTNYGRRSIDVSAPGGNFDYLESGSSEICTVGPVTQLCGAFDLVYSTFDGGRWGWSFGTSQAAAHASGVAALIISENSGDMKPSQVARELRRRAIDGTGGADYHGSGFVTSGH